MPPGDEFDRAVRRALVIALVGVVLLCCLALALVLVLTTQVFRDPLE